MYSAIVTANPPFHSMPCYEVYYGKWKYRNFSSCLCARGKVVSSLFAGVAHCLVLLAQLLFCSISLSLFIQIPGY